MAATNGSEVLDIPFPAHSKSSSSIVGEHLTSVTRIDFADKILLTVSQAGKLSHWVHVPLSAGSATDFLLGGISGTLTSEHDPLGNNLLPLPHLTATTVFGGTKRDDEVFGQTLATNIASAILVKNAREQRMLVMGLGLENAAVNLADRACFDQAVGLVMEVL